MLMKRDKDMIRFSGRRHTKTGIISAIIGVMVVLGFLTICIISGVAGGKGDMILGFVGILLFGLAVFGFVLSYKALKIKDIFFRFPVIGASLNGIMSLLLFILYIVGFLGGLNDKT